MGIMDAEKTFDEELHYLFRNRIESVLENVNRRFHGYYADSKEEAVNTIKQLLSTFGAEIGGGVKTLGVGDSLSVHQIGAFDYLYELKDQIEIINPFERLEDGRFSEFAGYPNEWLPKDIYDQINRRIWEKARRALLSDVFITGANAITYDGKIVSTDGTGNRIAAMIYGPYKVILVVGRNKIVSDTEAAMKRIKDTAAPWNHYRHFIKHKIKGEKAENAYGIYKFANLPCVKQGKCVDCNAPLCTRHATVIVEKDTGGLFKDRIHVILVNEDLGC